MANNGLLARAGVRVASSDVQGRRRLGASLLASLSRAATARDVAYGRLTRIK